MKDFFGLLHVQPEDVTGLLEEIEPDGCPGEEGISTTFHYIRFRNSKPRLDNFISKLCDLVIAYCLDRDKHETIGPTTARPLWLKAKQKFARPNNSRTGEPGELVTFFLLEGYLRVPKVFSKMSLKTNPQMHVHGSDGVHLGIDDTKLTLYFGESKIHKSRSSAIGDALCSIKDFVASPPYSGGETQEVFEIQVLTDNLDIPEGPLRDRVLSALDPYSREHSDLQHSYVCFIGFDLELLADSCDKNEFVNTYKEEARRCYSSVLSRVGRDPTLSELDLHFFFIPFSSVDDFRESFLKELEK
jgi:hypothetical protein